MDQRLPYSRSTKEMISCCLLYLRAISLVEPCLIYLLVHAISLVEPCLIYLHAISLVGAAIVMHFVSERKAAPTAQPVPCSQRSGRQGRAFSRHQREDQPPSNLPTRHLFGRADGTVTAQEVQSRSKEMIKPGLIYIHAISLVALAGGDWHRRWSHSASICSALSPFRPSTTRTIPPPGPCGTKEMINPV